MENFNYLVNQTLTPIQAIVALKDALVASGKWNVEQSSDGITNGVSTSGAGQVSNGAVSGERGLDNSGAWFVIRQVDPDTKGLRRSFCFQRRSVSNAWHIKYSRGAGFQPADTTQPQKTPTATDQAVVVGDDTGSTGQLIANSLQPMRVHIAVDKDPPFGFFLLGHTFSVDTISIQMGLVMDPIVAGAPDADEDRCVLYVCTSTEIREDRGLATPFRKEAIAGLATRGTTRAWLTPPVVANRSFDTTSAMTYSAIGGIAVPGGLGTNIFTGKMDVLPIVYMRLGQPNGGLQGSVKGVGQYMRWNGVGGNAANVGDTLEIDPTASPPNRRIIVGDVSLPWKLSDTPTL